LKERSVETVKEMEAQYLFGDSDIAARRLQLLARVFAESTRQFLREASPATEIPLALDLGCGPGFTTHLIGQTLRCARVVGLDASPRFIEIARASATARVAFHLFDACAEPFPSSPADLIYCSLLLTHLEDPAGRVAKWATQLKPRGLLMVEEVEVIRTAHPVFSRYVRIVEVMLASQRNCLYAGPTVGALGPSAGLAVARNGVRAIPVKSRDTARMFVLNMQVWKDGDFVHANYPAASIRDLEAALGEIAQDQSATPEMEMGYAPDRFSELAAERDCVLTLNRAEFAALPIHGRFFAQWLHTNAFSRVSASSTSPNISPDRSRRGSWLTLAPR
jgi:trans-aconitate methyltransferase